MVHKNYETDRMILRTANPALARQVSEFYQRNATFLSASEPMREQEFYTEEFQRRALTWDYIQAREVKALRFWLLPKDDENGQAIGMAGLEGIVYGARRSAYLTFRVDENKTRQGYMQEALEKVVKIAFEDVELHRIEADIMPQNAASLYLVKKLGFEEEGLSRKSLKINGVWEDHMRLALLNETDE